MVKFLLVGMMSVSIASFAERTLVYEETATSPFIHPEGAVTCTPPSSDSFIPQTLLEISWPEWVTFDDLAQFNAREFFHAIDGKEDRCPELKHLTTGNDLKIATINTKQYEAFKLVELISGGSVCIEERQEESTISYGGFEFKGYEKFTLGAVDAFKCQ